MPFVLPLSAIEQYFASTENVPVHIKRVFKVKHYSKATLFALGMMIACTASTIYDPARMSDADSILVAQYLELSGLVGAYFGFSGVAAKK